jgi:hypothetical protein
MYGESSTHNTLNRRILLMRFKDKTFDMRFLMEEDKVHKIRKRFIVES